ncbi:MAG: Hint domain-containing protein [Candidatus Thermoplasmatota archaeon]
MVRLNLNNQAVTSVLSLALVMMIFFSSVGVIFLWGLPAINQAKLNAQREASFSNLDRVDNTVDEVVKSGTGASQQVSIEGGDNFDTISIDEDSGRLIAAYTREPEFYINVSGLEDKDESFKVEANESNSQMRIDNVSMYWTNDSLSYNQISTCFLAGTRVLMADGGYKNIENIVVGDRVKCYDEENDRVVESNVVDLHFHQPGEMDEYYLRINDELCVTPNHRFYTDNGWKTADELEKNDLLFSDDEGWYTVSSVEKVYKKVETYDLSVRKNHNYFVELNGKPVLVHNSESTDTDIYYFNSYDSGGEEWDNPGYMVDGSLSNFAKTKKVGDVELLTGNSYSGGGSGTISKVEVRAYGEYAGDDGDIYLRPVFGGSDDGDNHEWTAIPSSGNAAWSQWFDITSDTNAPSDWSWIDVDHLDMDVECSNLEGALSPEVRIAEVEIRVTYSTDDPPDTSIDSLPDPAGPSDVYPFTGGSSDDNGVNDVKVQIADPDGNKWNPDTGGWERLETNFFSATPSDGSWGDTSENWEYDITNDGGSYTDGATYDITAKAIDTAGQEDGSPATESFTFTEGNTAPDSPSNPSPDDGAKDVSTSPTLSVVVSDSDGDSMDVTFYDNSDDSEIGSDDDVSDGDTASVTWSDLSGSKTYRWYVVVTDGNGGEADNKDTPWKFTTRTIPLDRPERPSCNYNVFYNDTNYKFTTSSPSTEQGKKLQYGWDWNGDKKVDIWDDNSSSYYTTPPYDASNSNSWSSPGVKTVRVKVKEDDGSNESAWSPPLVVNIIERATPFSSSIKSLSSKNGQIEISDPESPQEIEITVSDPPSIVGTVSIHLFNDSYPESSPGNVSFATIYIFDLGCLKQEMFSSVGTYVNVLENDALFSSQPSQYFWEKPPFIKNLNNHSTLRILQIRSGQKLVGGSGGGLYKFSIHLNDSLVLDNAQRPAYNLRLQFFGENKEIWMEYLTRDGYFEKWSNSDFPLTLDYKEQKKLSLIVRCYKLDVTLEKIT